MHSHTGKTSMSGLQKQVKLAISVLANPELSPLAKVIFMLLLLKYRDGKTGRCDPSANTIGDLVRRHERIVRGAIDGLKAAGEIKTLERKGTSSLYSFLRLDDREQPRLKTAGLGPAVFVTPVRLKTAAKPSEENLLSLRERAPQASKAKKGSRAKGTRLPEDWQPSQADRDFAIASGLENHQTDTEAVKFRNYWTAKAEGATKINWPRTWQNWILNSRHYGAGKRTAARQDAIDPGAWDFHVGRYRSSRSWLPTLGPTPDHAGCRAPLDVLHRHGFGRAAGAAAGAA
jgi:hypothetical protein